MRRCNKCHHETDLFFCPNCGNIIEVPAYIAGIEELEKSLASHVAKLVKDAKEKKIDIAETINKSKYADVVFRKYYEHMSYLKEICSNPTVSNLFERSGFSIINKMAGFGEKCRRNECQIAVVGTIKAGKSMFLNAVIGKEVASTYPTPETAAVTKFRYSDSGYYVKVTYYNDSEWEELWNSVTKASKNTFRDDREDFLSEYKDLKADLFKDRLINHKEDIYSDLKFEELKEKVDLFTSARHAEHFFAKEVEVGLTEFNVPKNVVFVDTPGLNDPVSFRSDITKRYIASANVVLLCVKAASAEIRAAELEEIGILFSEMRYAKDRLYLFATQYDTPDDFQEYWKKYTKPEFVKYLSSNSYFESEQKANERIIPVSPLYYLMCQRAKNDRSQWEEGTETEKKLWIMVDKCLGIDRHHNNEDRFYDHIAEIEKLTNVEEVNRIILEGPVKKAEEIIVQDIKGAYNDIRENVQEVSYGWVTSHHTLIEQSKAADINKRISEELQSIANLEQNHKVNLQRVEDILNDIEESNTTMINEIKNKQ